MLRQVIIFQNNEQIFSYHFAKAYDADTLDILINKRLAPYIQNPINGKVYNKPMFDFQAHFGMFNSAFFLFVTDMADRPKTIQKEIERSVKLFKKNFETPEAIKADSPERDEFTVFIQETHYFLHPKICLMGPVGAGKTTITNYLKLSDEPDKTIMNFAEYYKIKFGKTFFDLWDFIQDDNFSPLWNNFIRGSDLIFFVLDGTSSSINDRQIQFFHNLKRRDGKYSRWVVLLTHADESDFVGKENFISNFQNLGKIDVYEIDLTAIDAKEQLDSIFRDVIGLKQPLPPSFRTKLIEANNCVQDENYADALRLLEELSPVAREYQEFKYLEVINSKIEELNTKLEDQRKKEEREKRKIKAPKKISFGSFNGPKTLDGPKNLPSMKKVSNGTMKAPPLPKVSNGAMKAPPLPNLNIPPKTELSSENKNNLPGIKTLPTKEVVHESQESSENSSKLDTSIVADVESSNPFFTGLSAEESSGLTPKQSSTPPSSLTKKPANVPKVKSLTPNVSAKQSSVSASTPKEVSIPSTIKIPPKKPPKEDNLEKVKPLAQNVKGASLDKFQIKVHKIDPINVDELDKNSQPNKHSQLAENLLQKSISGIKSGQTREKKLTFERSPLVSAEKSRLEKPTINFAKQSRTKRNPLEMFTLGEEKQTPKEGSTIRDYAEQLGQEIRSLGESLSQDLCVRFIKQIQVSLKKTNLNTKDIKKAASLYVLQRRKKKGNE